MRRPARTRSARPPEAERQQGPNARRDRLAMRLAVLTVACLGVVFLLANGTQFLMPGPLASAHGAIENCSACHTKSGSGNLSWVHGFLAGDPVADSKACLSCHKMPDTAFNAHSAPDAVLKQSTERLMSVAARTPAPLSAHAQGFVFPTDDMVAQGLHCATCHKEHKGHNVNLKKISNEQCRACHVVKFDSFDGHHPEFENYPFKRRTPIIYDHASHFGKHFPETAQKDPARRIPATCSTCHDSRRDKRVMAVAPFEQTCSGCHLEQITGKERVSGPKGIAFLSLPGLDLQTLKKKNAAIGEWPAESEAELTPFMKVMLSAKEPGRALIKAVDNLNLQDLSDASDAQIEAVTKLVWEIKRLFYALITGKVSDVLADLGIGGGARLSANLVADLTASIPRDVVIGAHQQWLPNLGTEMTNRRDGGDREPSPRMTTVSGWTTTIMESRAAVEREETGTASGARAAPPEEAARQADPAAAARPGRRAPSADEQPRSRAADQTDDLLNLTEEELRTMTASGRDTVTAVRPARAVRKIITAAARPDKEMLSMAERTQARRADQTDDLLYPDGGAPEAASARPPVSDGTAGAAAPPPNAPAAAPPAPGAAAAEPPLAKPVPVISIESDVDPESWAEYGGWYRQDYTIYYRPTGHKDKFVYTWLFLTGPQAPKGDRSPAAAVFDFLTSKDAQGSCTKCHSVDDIQGKGRMVSFSPPSVASKQGRFTNFVHEPHFGVLENRGCLTCHALEKGRPYQQSYAQGDPARFVSSFGDVKKELCQTCHASSMARQDCLLCHKYHLDGVITPIMSTKIPTE